MDPDVRDSLKQFSSSLASIKSKPPVVLYSSVNNSTTGKILAYRTYEVLRQNKLIDGYERLISHSYITSHIPLKFGKNSELLSQPAKPEKLLFVLNFGERTASQIREGIESLMLQEERKDAAPSRLSAMVEPFERLTQIAGITLNSVKAKGDDIVITANAGNLDEERLGEFRKALLDAGLQSSADLRHYPLTFEQYGEARTHIPLGGKSLEEISSALFDTEILLRERCGDGRKWQNKVASTLINDTSQRRQ